MSTPTVSPSQTPLPAHHYLPASRYDFNALATVYNAARVDYIVPMPMNGKRMQEYVTAYDVNLEASVVSLNSTEEQTGIGMVGLRDRRGWITRLGVIPEQRKHKVGRFIMDRLLENAHASGADLIQLEVIRGNDPAHRLFLSLGFAETRELCVLRRPPGKLDPALMPPESAVALLPAADIPTLLQQREPGAAWTEETASLLNAGRLEALEVELASGERGWVIFQQMAFQLTHIVLSAQPSAELAQALLYHLHARYSMQDTKLENLPVDHPLFPIFQRMGYVESFRRIEMALAW
ncbi:MAG: GNAT family N-acetyltransferase [Anaerolineae bacterium]